MKVAALYVDPKGPYPAMSDVDAWDLARDARTYGGPWPVVAHPPCGPWGKLAHMCKHQDKTAALIAVEQVRRFGGVLEHPEASRLWRELRLPLPDGLPVGNEFSIRVDQCRWGHPCRKPTWLLCSGVPLGAVTKLPPWREPIAAVTNSASAEAPRPYMANRRRATPAEIKHTTPEFARWLVNLAKLTRSPNHA